MTETGFKEVFDQFRKVGEEPAEMVVGVLLDEKAWRKKDAMSRCLREGFRILSIQLAPGEMEGGVSNAPLLVARLLAGRAEELHSFVNQDGLERILGQLDLKRDGREKADVDVELRGYSTLAVSRFIEASKEVAESMVEKFMVVRIAREEDDELRAVFSAAAALFPVATELIAKLMLTGGYMESIVGLLRARPEDVEAAALEMLNAACVDKNCRQAVKTHCYGYLQSVSNSNSPASATAAVVLAKLQHSQGPGETSNLGEMEDLTKTFMGLLTTPDVEQQQKDISLEGLAYTSLNGPIKNSLVSDATFLSTLITTLKASSSSPSTLFGALTIINNIITYPPLLSSDEKRLSQLKKYAEARGHSSAPDPTESTESVTTRCTAVLNAGVIPALISVHRALTPTGALLTAKILLSLSQHPAHRGTFAKEGGVKLLLHLAAPLSQLSSSEGTGGNEIALTAAHSLARVLISLNPGHIFTTGFPVTSPIRPLLALLKPDNRTQNLLPVFESLLALTNLASTGDDVRDLILRLAFTPDIEDLLLSGNERIQRAAVELVCNLMASTRCVALYADGTPQAKQRLSILIALTDSDDLKTRLAAGGAVAMLLEYEQAVEILLNTDRGVERCMGMVTDEEEDMRWRGLVCIGCLVGVQAGKKRIKEAGGEEIVRDGLRSTRNPGVLQVGVEVLKALKD